MHNIIDNEQKLTMLRNNLVFHAPKLIFDVIDLSKESFQCNEIYIGDNLSPKSFTYIFFPNKVDIKKRKTGYYNSN